jgi:hypothetical protein
MSEPVGLPGDTATGFEAEKAETATQRPHRLIRATRRTDIPTLLPCRALGNPAVRRPSRTRGFAESGFRLAVPLSRPSPDYALALATPTTQAGRPGGLRDGWDPSLEPRGFVPAAG